MGRASGFVWDTTPEVAFNQLMARYAERVRRGAIAIAYKRAPQIADWMKANHPWQNVTGAAEAGLHTTVLELALDMIAIILAHGDDIEYAEALEYAHGGAWGVIAPALDYWGQVVWQDVRRLVTSERLTNF